MRKAVLLCAAALALCAPAAAEVFVNPPDTSGVSDAGNVLCPACGFLGGIPGISVTQDGQLVECPECNGQGLVPAPAPEPTPVPEPAPAPETFVIPWGDPVIIGWWFSF